MKIRYIHSADPGVEKTYDTVLSLEGCKGFIRAMGSNQSKKEWDRQEVERFERDRRKGIILSYRVVEEGENE
jgi:hypothetical protein